MSVKGGPNTVTSGLVLELDAGNIKSYQSGSITWFDKSGFANNGTLTNGPTFNTGSGGSIVFDGVDDYVDCGNNINPTSSFSCAAWINFTTTTLSSSDTAFLSKWSTVSSAAKTFIFGYRNSGGQKGISLYLYDTSYNQQDNYRTDWNPSSNTWYYAVGVFSASNYVKIYINGVEDYSRTTSVYSSLNPDSIQSIISGRLTGLGYFPGRIAYEQMYNRALSADEVLQNYNAVKSRFGL